jgi:hypothetical protein
MLRGHAGPPGLGVRIDYSRCRTSRSGGGFIRYYVGHDPERPLYADMLRPFKSALAAFIGLPPHHQLCR